MAESTHAQAILESLAPDRQRLEEVRDRSSARLRVACCAGRRELRWGVEGHSFGRLDSDIGPLSHDFTRWNRI